MQVSLGGVCISWEHLGPFLTANKIAWRVCFHWGKKTLNLTWAIVKKCGIYTFLNTWWSGQSLETRSIHSCQGSTSNWLEDGRNSWRGYRAEPVLEFSETKYFQNWHRKLEALWTDFSPRIYTFLCISWFHYSQDSNLIFCSRIWRWNAGPS